MKLFNSLKTLFNSREKKKPEKKATRKTQRKAGKKPQKKIQKKIKKKTQKRPGKTLQRKKPSKHSKKSQGKTREKEIGVITHYFNKISVGIIKLKAGLKTGDEIHIKGAHDDFTQFVTSMQLNHKDISHAPKGAEAGIKVTQRVHENDKVYNSPQHQKLPSKASRT